VSDAHHAVDAGAGGGHHPNSPERDGMFFSRVFPAPAASGGRPPALFRHRFSTLQSHDNLELVLQVDDGAVGVCLDASDG
jgi:hypothetical protein